MTDWIAELSDHVGVGSGYRGFDGRHVDVPSEIRAAVLRAMGHDIVSSSDARDRLERLRREDGERPSPHEVIVNAGQPARVAVTRPLDWSLEAETTETLLTGNSTTGRIDLPALPMGIYRLVLSAGPREWATWLIARPSTSTSVSDRCGNDRIWGITTTLFGMTDGSAVPIGTYAMLGQYAAAMAMHGADFVGINPIHAMGRTRPGNVISPYSPSHREFLNTWHVSMPAAFRPVGADLIDYPTALAANDQALAEGFARFRDLPRSSPEASDFAEFEAASGAALHQYALFEALADDLGPDWRDWPAPYRDRSPQALEAFTRSHASHIDFVKWSQWQANRQMHEAQDRAIGAGMRVGLYLDLAVGPRLGGAETWVAGTPLVTGASLGAPPDPLCPSGQSWGLAPMSPQMLRSQGYGSFARLLRAVMRHAGMVRIDHVLGLMRSFWIPEGAAGGAYVSYPFDALLAILAIESARSRTIVIGEDLGLVPSGFRDRLEASGIYGLDVLQYMRTRSGGFSDTAATRRRAACTFGTHDTATIAGFFQAEDARLRAGLGTLTAAEFDRVREDRAKARASLGDAPVIPEIHRRLARARSEIVAVQLDDVAGRTGQQNLPGTVDEHPNWRLSAPFSLSEVRNSPVLAEIGSEMRAAGRANRDSTENDHDRRHRQDLAH